LHILLEIEHDITKFNGGVKKMQIRENNNSNEILIAAAASAIEQMKYEIALEFGVTLGPDSTARANGSVGGEITKRLVRMAQEQLSGQYKIH
jgi:small acid-soluble spore protein B (major beta-type SASP)